MDCYYSGLVFGRFQGQLANFPTETIYEPIEDFHNTPCPLPTTARDDGGQLPKPYGSVPKGAGICPAREQEVGIIVEKLNSGQLPLQVTHNDTKLNDIPFDFDTRTSAVPGLSSRW